ncbi:MAG: hypothetical protein RL318_1225 [Fibrobacterota bacterium]|jgi:uncharacterized LabA/DUF88 family protein
MPTEPTAKTCIAFVDAQALFHAARQAFGCFYPDYDPIALCKALCEKQGWELAQVRVYTSIPPLDENEHWHRFWMNKLRALEHAGAFCWWRPWRFRRRPVKLPDGQTQMLMAAIEKGVDMRISLDIITRAHSKAFDVALVFSQDQDLAEVADEIRAIARNQDRWIKIASAYPYSSASRSFRGIDRTDWIQVDRETYDACLDPRDYRPKRARPMRNEGEGEDYPHGAHESSEQHESGDDNHTLD